MNTHDENSPSQLEKRIACPGSRAAEAGIPDRDDEHSDRGTTLHGAMAQLLRAKTHDERCAVLCNFIRDDLEALELCLAEADALREKARAMHRADGGSVLELIEYHVDLSEMGIHHGGTLDFALVIPGRMAWLRDWKFGSRIARWPKNNPQLQAYSVGLWTALGCETIEAGIYQPAVEEQGPAHTWTAEDMPRIQDEIARAVARTFAPEAPLVPGKHCQFCRAKPTCAVRAEQAGTVAVLRDPVAVMRATAPADRAALWERLEVALQMLDGAREAIRAEALAGTIDIPGYAAIPTKKDREWTDAAAARQALLTLATAKGLTADDIEPRKLLSPGGAEKLLGKGKAVQAALSGLTVRESGSPKLGKVSA